MPVFCTFPRASALNERREKLETLTTCRTRMSYFDIGTLYPIRSARRLFSKRGQYLDDTLTVARLFSLYLFFF